MFLVFPVPVKMRLIIRNDSEQASAYVANYIVERIKHFSPTPAHPFVLGLPTGSSPLGVYRILVAKYKAGEVSIPRTRYSGYDLGQLIITVDLF